MLMPSMPARLYSPPLSRGPDKFVTCGSSLRRPTLLPSFLAPPLWPANRLHPSPYRRAFFDSAPEHQA